MTDKIVEIERILKYILYSSNIKENIQKETISYTSGLSVQNFKYGDVSVLPYNNQNKDKDTINLSKYRCECPYKASFDKCTECWHDNHSNSEKCNVTMNYRVIECGCENYETKDDKSKCVNCKHDKLNHRRELEESFEETSKCGCPESYKEDITNKEKDLSTQCTQCLHYGYDHTTYNEELPITQCTREVNRKGIRKLGINKVPCFDLKDEIIPVETPWLELNAKKPETAPKEKSITFIS